MTQARCAVVIVVDGAAGSGYSVIGPLDAQVLLRDIVQQIADALRGQLVKSLQYQDGYPADQVALDPPATNGR